MNEYYKSRYNISKFFLNIDTDTYNNYLHVIIPLLYLIPIILFTLLIVLAFKIINITILLYLIIFVILLIATYKLINSLKSIITNPIINNYYDSYKLANLIYKENFENSDYVKSFLKSKLLQNINNIENLYGDKALIHLNNTYDILQYDEINEETSKYMTKLYINDFKKFKFLNQSMPFIYNIDTTIVIDLEVLNNNFPSEKKLLLKYFNDKYNINLNSLYQPFIFNTNNQKKMDKLIDNFKFNIYLYISVISYFILILLQGILINISTHITYIYLGIIIILLILMYIYNNI